MKTLQGIISAGFLFVGSVILLCFGLDAGAVPLLAVGGCLALVSGILLIVPVFSEIYLTEEKEKTEGNDHEDV